MVTLRPPSITLTVDDSAGPSAGNGTTYYKWDDAGFTSPFTYSSAINMNTSIGQGTHTLYWKTTDTAGNQEASIKSQEFKLDSVAPNTSYSTIPVSNDGTNGWFKTNPTITLTGSDPAPSGGEGNIIYRWDNPDLSSGTTTYSTAVNMNTDIGQGTHTLYWKATDSVGNEATQNQQFKLDTALPSSTLSSVPVGPDGNGGFFKTNPSITLTGSDPISGIASVVYKWDDITLTSPTTYTVPISGLEGTHTLYWRTTDNAGNQEAIQSQAYNIDSADPTIQSVNSNKANGSYKAGDVIDIRVNFSENVFVDTSGGMPQITTSTNRAVDYSAGSGTSTLIFNYTIQAGDTSTDLDYLNNTALVFNSGTIEDATGNSANLNLADPGTANSLGANKSLVIDTTAPTITDVTSSTGNGSYKATQTVNVTVNFSENVTLSGGNLLVALDTGRTVTITPFGPANTASGTYTIQSGDTSSDLTATSPLTLSAGTLRDAASNDTVLAIPGSHNLGDNKNIIIDTTAPTISDITSSTTNGSYKVGQDINLTINFTENITLSGGGNLRLTLDTGRQVNISGFGPANTVQATYTIQTGDTSADLSVNSPLILTAGTLRDSAGNDLVLAIPAGHNLSDNKDIQIDTQTPTISNVTSTTVNGAYKAGLDINVTVNFSENVALVGGNLSIALNTGQTVLISPFASTNTVSATYTIQSGDNSADLAATSPLTLTAGTLKDSAGNDTTLTIPNGQNVSDLKNIQIDTTAPNNISVSINGGAVYANANPVALAISATDNISGVYQMQLSNDGLVYDSWELYNTSKIWDLTDPLYGGNSSDEPKTVYAKFRDVAGNQTAPITATVTLDRVAPTNPSSPTPAQVSPTDSTPLINNTWHNHTNPQFDLTGASDATSGLDGYYVYWGTVSNAEPMTLGTFQTVSTFSPTLSLPDSGQTFYLRARDKDRAGNLYTNTDTSQYTLFTYKFDVTNPDPISYITPNPTGWSSNDSFSFTWPTASDPLVNGASSGIKGYEYKRQIDASWTFTDQTSVSSIQSYQNGVNVLQVRTVDNAGNYSPTIPVNYYYAGSIPAPTNLTADISQSSNQTVNRFKFTWDAPWDTNPQGYYYSINAIPDAQNSVFTLSPYTPYDAFATHQGLNTFYVVLKDESGNVGWANFAQTNFTCNTVAPGTPEAIMLSDISNREASRWQLAMNWSEPSTTTPDFNSYVVERSTDGLSFTQIATTAASATGYLDTNLSSNQTYYYRVRAKDSTGNVSAASTTVYKQPTGKYTTPPNLIGSPETEVQATKAIVKFTTDRPADSFIQYGLDTSYGQTQGQLESTQTHTVNITGLNPGSNYHLRAMWRDSDGNVGYSPNILIRTQDAPGISDAKVSDIRLSTAIVTWRTNTISTSKVLYGTTIIYGQTAEDKSGSTVTTHTLKLEGLDHSTTYHFRIVGTDTDGNPLEGEDHVFTTLTYPKVHNVKFEQQKNTATSTVKVTWESNVPTTSIVEYLGGDLTTPKESAKSALSLKHTLTISNLKDNASYQFKVKGRDAYGNEAISDSFKVKTDLDSRPPAIFDITTEASTIGFGNDAKGQVIISWQTDEPATSQVEYSTGTSGDNYDQRTQEDSALATTHVIVLSDLKSSSSYHFRVVSKDNAENKSESEDTSLLTNQAQKSVVDIVIKSLEDSIGWIFSVFGSREY